MTDTTHHIARGRFEVKMTPQGGGEEQAEGVKLGRLMLEKVFHGDLEATSQGQMLTAVTDTPGSAGYVAIERVTGTLQGRAGSFVFQHSGTMDHGAQQLSITVVPSSGGGELTGLVGRFALRIEDGQHFYEFHYKL
jgi:hypothetical protein